MAVDTMAFGISVNYNNQTTQSTVIHPRVFREKTWLEVKYPKTGRYITFPNNGTDGMDRNREDE